jgi:hypothetical protein
MILYDFVVFHFSFIYQGDHIPLLVFTNVFMLECSIIFLGLMQNASLGVPEIVEVLMRSTVSTSPCWSHIVNPSHLGLTRGDAFSMIRITDNSADVTFQTLYRQFPTYAFHFMLISLTSAPLEHGTHEVPCSDTSYRVIVFNVFDMKIVSMD